MESVYSSFQLVMVMMKMAAVSSIIVVLLCSVLASAGSQAGCDYNAATNGNFTVPLHLKLTGSENLRWKHNSDVIFNRRSTRLVTGNERDVSQNGSLLLTHLDKSKAGTYTPEVYEDGKAKGDLKSIRLCILDPVSKPQVKIQCIQSSVKFTCISQNKPDYEWLQNDKMLEKGQTLQFKTAKEVETDMFRCKVSNPISFMVSAPVKQNCIKPDSGFPEKIFGINTWILVGGGGGVVVVLIIVIIVCCVCNKRKKRIQLKDEEELRLGWTNPNQQHHQQQHNHPPNQHHHHQQQPAGHTGPRQPRSKQQRNLQRPRDPNQSNGQPQPSPRRAAQGSRPVANDDEQPPPLPQPRKKTPKIPRV